MNEDLVFSLDPSSTRTGWSIMQAPEQLVRFGLLLPDNPRAASEVRISNMCSGLWDLLNYWQPKTILLEYGSGKVNPRRHHGGGSGLQIHGISIGAIWREILAWLRYQPPEDQIRTKVHPIRENQWARSVRKEDRAVAIAAMFPEYNQADDPGLDVADAIGLAVWFLRENKVRTIGCKA